jgi:predicted alpha/beta-fold hydrolase
VTFLSFRPSGIGGCNFIIIIIIIKRPITFVGCSYGATLEKLLHKTGKNSLLNKSGYGVVERNFIFSKKILKPQHSNRQNSKLLLR